MSNTSEYNFLCYAHNRLKRKQKENKIGFTFGFCYLYYLYTGDKDSDLKYRFPDFWNFIKKEKTNKNHYSFWLFNNVSERLEVLNKYLADKYNIVLE